jgi:hypothetical protein
MGKLSYHFRRWCAIIILLCGFCAFLGVSMLVGWGLAWTVARLL